ncbi:hypothetical protein [Vibrio quintilis]|uniref:Uncharacterized protein n=1 Tax=Vibrio quintilis TaxID=1117707 RepID=A0A1M7Z333_9VIBR|nr:hypothetical protein [Vibrio quintilis]SHO59303.1 hypothetical protein VQ7734_05083 [Vibrio quintilis]
MLTPEGEIEIDFKRDENYIWLCNVDSDSQEYEDLDIQVINQIKSWERLPEDFSRYWHEV